MKKYIKPILLMLMALIAASATAQTSREYIRNSIKRWGECRNVAITKKNGDIALAGKHGYSYKNIPTGLANAIKEEANNDNFIDDIQLTDRGRWCLLYGKNGFRWSDVPYDMERAMRNANEEDETVTAVSFNDDGRWAVISEEYIRASDDIREWISDGGDKYGQVWTICITDDAIVVVYEEGFKYHGNVPEDLKQKLKNCDFDVFHLKISGSSWFFSNRDGSKYDYKM